MVALARNLHFLRSRFLTDLTAVFVALRRYAFAWEVRTFGLCSCHHHGSPFSGFTYAGSYFPFVTDEDALRFWELPSRVRVAHELQLAGAARAVHEEQVRP